jgi:hypothetical protein
MLPEPKTEYAATTAGIEAHKRRSNVAGVGFVTHYEDRLIVSSVPVVDKRTNVTDEALEVLCSEQKVLLWNGEQDDFRSSVFYDEGFAVRGSYYYRKHRTPETCLVAEAVKGYDRGPRFIVIEHAPKLRVYRERRRTAPTKIPVVKLSKEEVRGLVISAARHMWGVDYPNHYDTMEQICNRLDSTLAKFSALYGSFAYRRLGSYITMLRLYASTKNRSHLPSRFQDWADEELATPAVQRLLRAKKFVEGTFHYSTSEFGSVYSRRLKREEAEAARKARQKTTTRRKARTVAEALAGAEVGKTKGAG